MVALTGFLYQVLGFAGIKALAKSGREENDHETAEVPVRLVRVGDNTRANDHDDHPSFAVGVQGCSANLRIVNVKATPRETRVETY